MSTQVHFEPSVEVQVGPEQGGQPAPIIVGQPPAPARVGQHDLNQHGVEIADRCLQQVQRESGHLHALSVVAGQLSCLAVEDVFVGAVPVLDDVQSLLDLGAQVEVREVVADYVESDLSRLALCAPATGARGHVV